MRATTTFLAVPLLTGCSEYNPVAFPQWPPGHEVKDVGEDTQTDEIVQVTSPQADVLWMIDNSGSMEAFQERLVQNFPAFMDYFDGSGIDYHVGVTSSDVDGHYNGASGSLVAVAGVRYLDPSIPDPVAMFQAMATLGTGGSGDEQGTAAIYLALEVKRDTDNAGFWRDEAAIHTIVISDEADSSPMSPDEFIGWYGGLKPELDQRTFSSIVDPQDGGSYLRITRTIGGVEDSILDDDWDAVLERLGIQAAGLKREYFLSRLPVEDTIEVTVVRRDGVTLPPFEPGTGWTYDALRNSITFAEFVPDPLSTVRISYTVLASRQEELEELPGAE